MDRNFVRKLAKLKYKEAMKSIPKSQRIPFSKAFHLIKAEMANSNVVPDKEIVSGSDVENKELPADMLEVL